MSQHKHNHSKAQSFPRKPLSRTHPRLVPQGLLLPFPLKLQRGASWGSQRWRDIPLTHSWTVARSPSATQWRGFVLTS